MTNSILGRPINGTISHYGSRTLPEQWPIEQFVEKLDAVLAFDDVQAVKWHQYTPYFNDGDACEFSIHEPRIRIEGVSEDAGEYEDGYLTLWDASNWPDGYWNTHSWRPVTERALASNADRIPTFEASDPEGILSAFADLIDSIDHFEMKMKEHFGDPAVIIATTSGFDVEFYDHD